MARPQRGGESRGPCREGLRPHASQGRVTRVLVVTAVELETRSLARQLGLERVGGSAWPHFRGGALELLCAGPPPAPLDAPAAGSAAPPVRSAGGWRRRAP